VLTTLTNVVREVGPAGLFRGFRASVLLCVNPAINYTVFEQLKKRLLASTGAKGLTTLQAFVLGAIGKIVATLCTYPWVRAKVMMQSGAVGSKVRLGQSGGVGWGELEGPESLECSARRAVWCGTVRRCVRVCARVQ
jgi:hypothetical protein